MNTMVLIIEDDDFLRSLAVSKLEKEGFSVAMAANGSDGLELIRSQKPAVVILDLMLPVMSGFEVLETLHTENLLQETQVIVFSNLGEDGDIKRCLELGAKDYLVKANFTLDELVEKIKNLLA